MVFKNKLTFQTNSQFKNLILIPILLINNITLLFCLEKESKQKSKFLIQENFILKNFSKQKKKHFLQTSTNITNSTNANTTSISLDTTTLIIIVAGSVVFIAVIVIIIVCCCKKKQKEENKTNKANASSNKAIELKESSIEIEKKSNELQKDKEDERIKSHNNEKDKSDNVENDFDKRENYRSEKQNKYIDESEIRENVNKHVDKSATDRRFLDSTDRNYQDNNMQKSFDLEEHFKNNLENLDDKDEKLHQYLAEQSNPNQKRLSPIDVKRYQENQMQKEKERDNNIIPDLISNFTDKNKDSFSDDSRYQNSVAESIDYKYFDHINEDNNISKLNKEREIPVKNVTIEDSKRNNISNSKYANINYDENFNNKNNQNNQNDFDAERNLNNYSSNKYFQKEELKVKDSNINSINNAKANYNKNQQQIQEQFHNDYVDDGEMDLEEYEEEEGENDYEDYEEDFNDRNKNKKVETNSRAKIGADGNIYNSQKNDFDANKQTR